MKTAPATATTATTRSSESPAIPASVNNALADLSQVRVLQRNLVYVVGLPRSLADEEMLRGPQWFARWGRVVDVKVAAARSFEGGGNSSGPARYAAFVTYKREQDAAEALRCVQGSNLQGHVLRAQYGTTKYCASFRRGARCHKQHCLFLHALAPAKDCLSLQQVRARFSVPQSSNPHAFGSAPPSTASAPSRSTSEQQNSQNDADGIDALTLHRAQSADAVPSSPAKASWNTGLPVKPPATPVAFSKEPTLPKPEPLTVAATEGSFPQPLVSLGSSVSDPMRAPPASRTAAPPPGFVAQPARRSPSPPPGFSVPGFDSDSRSALPLVSDSSALFDHPFGLRSLDRMSSPLLGAPWATGGSLFASPSPQPASVATDHVSSTRPPSVHRKSAVGTPAHVSQGIQLQPSQFFQLFAQSSSLHRQDVPLSLPGLRSFGSLFDMSSIRASLPPLSSPVHSLNDNVSRAADETVLPGWQAMQPRALDPAIQPATQAPRPPQRASSFGTSFVSPFGFGLPLQRDASERQPFQFNPAPPQPQHHPPQPAASSKAPFAPVYNSQASEVQSQFGSWSQSEGSARDEHPQSAAQASDAWAWRESAEDPQRRSAPGPGSAPTVDVGNGDAEGPHAEEKRRVRGPRKRQQQQLQPSQPQPAVVVSIARKVPPPGPSQVAPRMVQPAPIRPPQQPVSILQSQPRPSPVGQPLASRRQ